MWPFSTSDGEMAKTEAEAVELKPVGENSVPAALDGLDYLAHQVTYDTNGAPALVFDARVSKRVSEEEWRKEERRREDRKHEEEKRHQAEEERRKAAEDELRRQERKKKER